MKPVKPNEHMSVLITKFDKLEEFCELDSKAYSQSKFRNLFLMGLKLTIYVDIRYSYTKVSQTILSVFTVFTFLSKFVCQE